MICDLRQARYSGRKSHIGLSKIKNINDKTRVMKNIKSVLGFLIIMLAAFQFTKAQAPDVPSPAPAQQGKIYLTNATIHVGNGKVLQNATIGFENGKIIFLEENPSIKTDATMGQVIDCTG